jgi:hypothetical protein
MAYIHLRNRRVSTEVEIHGVQTYRVKERGMDARCESLTHNVTIVKMRTKPIKNIYVTLPRPDYMIVKINCMHF